MAAIHYLGFLIAQNFNFPYSSEGQYASSHQIWCSSVKPLPRYGHFSSFDDGRMDFYKFKILIAGSIRMTSMRHSAKFHDDRLNHCRDMAVFRIFKMATVRHLGFLTVENFNSP